MVSCRSDLSIPSQTMQLSLCLKFSVIKILCSPETQGEGLRLSLSVHISMTTHKCTCTQTHSHKQSRTLQKKRGSRATVYTVREEIVKNVSLLGGLFWSESVCQSETNRFRYYLHTIHTYYTYIYLFKCIRMTMTTGKPGL